MIVDATCTPADIRYPTDMSILNEARMNTEIFIDFLYENFRSELEEKPRDYRNVAHKDFISYTKKRKPRGNVRRKATRKQLNYLKRNIGHIEVMLRKIETLDFIHYDFTVTAKIIKLTERHEIVQKVYSQQLYMFTNKEKRVPDRIVSISQPHIRPLSEEKREGL